MSMKAVLLAVSALLVAGGTVYVAQGWLESERAALEARMTPPEQGETPFILVAKNTLATGTFVKPEHMRWQAWPDDNLSDSYLIQGVATDDVFAGAVVRSRVAAGEPITLDKIVKPGDRGFLAAVLAPGTRAVSVPLNATTGISGFVFPGDRVDLILSHEINNPTDEKRPLRRASETVLSDIRVLAVDQKTEDVEGKPQIAKTATLEVTPKQAEVIAVVTQLGQLSLSLRSLAHNGVTVDAAAAGEGDKTHLASAGPTYTWDSDVSQLLSGGGGKAATKKVTVLRGAVAEQIETEGPAQ